MLSFVLLTAVTGLLVVWYVRHLMTRPKNLPPGPSQLTVYKVFWELFKGRTEPLALFSSLADKYGEIFSFYVATKPVIFLNSYQMISKAFRHPDLNDRPKRQIIHEIYGTSNSVAGANGEARKEQRKFVHSVFRSLGVGKKTYENTVATELAQLSAAIRETKGIPFDPNNLFGQAIANIICSIVFGTQYHYDDPEFIHVVNTINTNFKLAGGGGAVLFLNIPGVSKVPFGNINLLANNIRSIRDIYMSKIESHEKTLDPDSPRDFIDQYLIKMGETKSSSFTNHALCGCVGDLFSAGTETTTTTLKWLILYMMVYPEVQSRVQDELDHVVGRGRLPKLEDQKYLPYTNAVLMEVQRKGVVAPLGVPHVAAEDVEIGGHTIPKGAIIVSNIWKVLNSEELWQDSHIFKPERFLNEDGKLVTREELIFFSTGRRVCLGENLARMETFLGFTSLLHQFTFKKPDNSPPLSLDGVLGLTRSTEPYMTCAIHRE